MLASLGTPTESHVSDKQTRGELVTEKVWRKSSLHQLRRLGSRESTSEQDFRAGEMAQWVTSLWCKHEDLPSYPQIPSKAS
jgi:hypothetical protein